MKNILQLVSKSSTWQNLNFKLLLALLAYFKLIITSLGTVETVSLSFSLTFFLFVQLPLSLSFFLSIYISFFIFVYVIVTLTCSHFSFCLCHALPVSLSKSFTDTLPTYLAQLIPSLFTHLTFFLYSTLLYPHFFEGKEERERE